MWKTFHTCEKPPDISTTTETIMGDFQTFVTLGLHHIADVAALDHILFILTLCAIYRPEAWKQIVILVTAFTLGHSLTLALAGFDLISIPSQWVESAIPLTIMATGAYNFFQHPHGKKSATDWRHYSLAAGFGLIHGMGFANYFRSLMMGLSGNIVLPLFSFNVGIEIGQLAIVTTYFTLLYAGERLFAWQSARWSTFLSGIGTGGALVLFIQGILENH